MQTLFGGRRNAEATRLPAADQQTQLLDQHGPGATSMRPGPPAHSGPKSKILGIIFMICVPYAVFFVTTMIISFMYHQHPTATWTMMPVIGGVGALCFVVDSRGKQPGRWYLKLGFLCTVSLAAGMYFAFHNYTFNFANYWAYTQNNNYVNVLPSEGAAAHSDAGKLLFSVDAMLDQARSVGYKNRLTYCVAPIVDYATTKIQYWATGTDCCAPRGKWMCGTEAGDDSVFNPNARSGVVVLESEGVFGDAYKNYRKAAAAACSEWNMEQADDPLFVRWVSDATAVQNEYYSTGSVNLALMNVGWLVGCVCVGALVQLMGNKHGAHMPATHTAAGEKVRLPAF